MRRPIPRGADRRLLHPGLAVVALVTAVAAGAVLAATPRELAQAKAAAVAAQRRARVLDARAEATDEPAARARLQVRAVAARVESAEAEIAAGQARQALVAAQLAAQRAELAAGQAPVARLLATLAALTRRPALLSVAQPGSLDDLVHVRAVLGATLPAVRARTQGLREDVARTRALRESAKVAARSLEAGRVRLVEARETLAALADGTDEAGATGRALSLGEEAREIVDQLRTVGSAQDVAAALVRLPGPPGTSTRSRAEPAPYRLPVAGRLVTGFGELSANGVRARGLTLAVAADAPVVAPAGGTVVFARAFRSFGGTVIIDHGGGWKSTVTGLGLLRVASGDQVAQGGAIGRARADATPQVMVELRRHGRPMDLAQLIG